MAAPGVTRETVEYEIETGRAMSMLNLRDSTYPWEALSAARIAEEDETIPKSFFYPCNDKDHAKRLRSSLQTSGNTFYKQRNIRMQVGSRVEQEGADAPDSPWGVRSWVFNLPPEPEPQDEA